MNYPNQENNQEENSEINVSPLLDMVFILLIFFVVTATFTRETGVDIKKPKASSATSFEDKIIKIAITREGTIHLYEKQVDLATLEVILKREKSRQASLKAVIFADSESVTGKLVKVIDICNQSGLQNVSIAAIKD